MAACERCWAEYQRRRICGDLDVTYSAVVAERDKAGGCSPREQCGDMHLLIGNRCRCGERLTREARHD